MKTVYSDGIFYKNNLRVNPFLASCVSFLSPGIAIDYGCGIGTNAVFLQGLGWNTFVVEREDLAIAEIKTKIPQEQVFQGDLMNFNFSLLPSCDLMTCNYVLQHLPQVDAQKFIDIALKKLKIGGYAVFSIFEREKAISFEMLSSFLERNNCSLLQSKKWTRWDYDHGPTHFHKGIESFWRKQ